MNKLILITVISFFTIFIVLACGGEKESGSAEKAAGVKEKRDARPQILTWTHIPIYPGARQQDATVLSGLPQYHRYETRIFASTDSLDAISLFYANQMPQQGWQLFAERDIEMGIEATWGAEDKNTMCWVRITQDHSGQGTKIEIIRAEVRKGRQHS